MTARLPRAPRLGELNFGTVDIDEIQAASDSKAALCRLVTVENYTPFPWTVISAFMLPCQWPRPPFLRSSLPG